MLIEPSSLALTWVMLMTLNEFQALSDTRKIKYLKRAMAGSGSHKYLAKDFEILKYSIVWLGGLEIIKSYENRILPPVIPELDI